MHKRLRIIIGLMLLVAALIATSPLTDVSASGGCAAWKKNCEDAALGQYDMCRWAGGSVSCCLDDYARVYNACMISTGCPYTPLDANSCGGE